MSDLRSDGLWPSKEEPSHLANKEPGHLAGFFGKFIHQQPDKVK